jgi:hypothetical protein
LKLYTHLSHLLLIISIVFFFSSCNKEPKKIDTPKSYSDKKTDSINKSNPSKTTNSDEICITGVGDIMMGTTYPNLTLPPNDGEDIFSDVADYLASSDITFGNLEGPMLDKGGTPKMSHDSSGRSIAFRMPTRYAKYLKDAGFDIMNIANNHSGDMGAEGRESTKQTLDELNIGFAGFITDPVYKCEYKNFIIGFAGFAPNNGTVSINDYNKAEEIISGLKKECDIVIVSFHGGAEGSGANRVTGEREFYLGENRGNVYAFAHIAIDAGADIVFGHGPHVSRAIELYNNRFIAYSLGNFCTYGKFGLSGELGLAPIMQVYVNKKGEFIKGNIIPTKQIKRGIPIFDSENKIVKVLQRLTKLDFPEGELLINDDGSIIKK